jgi:hypothetical protein
MKLITGFSRFCTLALAAGITLSAQSPIVVSRDGKYLGNLSSNPYDPNSIANPYGRYGSPYQADSVNNPYGRYGSPYSNQSANNPYATEAPIVIAPRPSYTGGYPVYRSAPSVRPIMEYYRPVLPAYPMAPVMGVLPY